MNSSSNFDNAISIMSSKIVGSNNALWKGNITVSRKGKTALLSITLNEFWFSRYAEQRNELLNARDIVRISRVFPKIGSLKLGKMRTYSTCDPRRATRNSEWQRLWIHVYEFILMNTLRKDVYFHIFHDIAIVIKNYYNQTIVQYEMYILTLFLKSSIVALSSLSVLVWRIKRESSFMMLVLKGLKR